MNPPLKVYGRRDTRSSMWHAVITLRTVTYDKCKCHLAFKCLSYAREQLDQFASLIFILMAARTTGIALGYTG